jgi:hypothetical protein
LIAWSIVNHWGAGCFPGDHHVHVIAAAEAVFGYRQQAIGVRRQVDPDHLGFLVDDMVDEPRVLVAQPVVVLPPDMRAEQVIEGCDRTPPRDVVAYLEPFGVLVEHRVDDMDERLVARKETVPSRQQVPLEPALALMFAEDLHHPAVGREMIVFGIDIRHVAAIGDLQHILPAVGIVLVGAEQPEVFIFHVQPHDVPKIPAHLARGLGDRGSGTGHIDRVVAKIGQLQIFQQQSAVGVRVVAHPAVAFRRQLGQFRFESAVGVEQLLRPVALHPLFEQGYVIGLGRHLGQRHLVRAP